MFVFGHLGIGSKMVSPWTGGLRRRHVLAGTLLPDLIDKPIYYLGVYEGTRTLGHTAILLLVLAAAAVARRSKLFAALALGMASHLFLDNLADHFLLPGRTPTALLAMTWPLSGSDFPIVTHYSETFMESFTPFILGGEAIGIGLLAWDQWKIHHEGEILEATQERRRFFKRIKKGKKGKAPV